MVGRGSGLFTRQRRLLQPAEFKRVFENPCRAGTRYLILLARDSDLEYPRLGLAISKKHVKTAVARNRIKRQVRESFRLHQDELGGLDIVVMTRPGSDKIHPRELRATLDPYWQKLAEKCAKS